MLLNNSNTNHSVVFGKTIIGQAFDIILLDWLAMCNETRKAIIEYAGYDDIEATALQDCTAAIIIPRRKGTLDLNKVYLHISTIGRIEPSDITSFITEYLHGNVDELENPVTLSGREKIEILCSLIPTKDLRGVI